jgi:hypothetical protein
MSPFSHRNTYRCTYHIKLFLTITNVDPAHPAHTAAPHTTPITSDFLVRSSFGYMDLVCSRGALDSAAEHSIWACQCPFW